MTGSAISLENQRGIVARDRSYARRVGSPVRVRRMYPVAIGNEFMAPVLDGGRTRMCATLIAATKPMVK